MDVSLHKLGDVCSFLNGHAFQSKQTVASSDVQLIRMGNLYRNNLDIDRKPSFYPESFAKEFERYLLNEGDLIMSLTGTVGKTDYGYTVEIPKVSRKLLLNQRIVKFIDLKKDVIDRKFLLHYLRSGSFLKELYGTARGVRQANLSTTSMKDLLIPTPSIPEQKCIVAILDQAFADIEQARAKTEQNLKNARELFESYLQQVFSQRGEGWSCYKLGDLCELISGQHIEAKDYNSEERGIGYLTGPSDFGELNPIVSKWTEHPKRTAVNGDILITVKGSGVGKVNVMNSSELAISRQLMAVRSLEADGGAVYWFLSMQFKYFQSLANGAAIPGISRGDVLNLELYLPPLIDQSALVREIELLKNEVTGLENNYSKKLLELDELKKSTLQKAFSGELTKEQKEILA